MLEASTRYKVEEGFAKVKERLSDFNVNCTINIEISCIIEVLQTICNDGDRLVSSTNAGNPIWKVVHNKGNIPRKCENQVGGSDG